MSRGHGPRGKALTRLLPCGPVPETTAPVPALPPTGPLMGPTGTDAMWGPGGEQARFWAGSKTVCVPSAECPRARRDRGQGGAPAGLGRGLGQDPYSAASCLCSSGSRTTGWGRLHSHKGRSLAEPSRPPDGLSRGPVQLFPWIPGGGD